jgi:hypothetical protein
MSAKPTKPQHQPETGFTGELQEFCGPAVAPDDPGLEPRVRRGGSTDPERASANREDTEDEA